MRDREFPARVRTPRKKKNPSRRVSACLVLLAKHTRPVRGTWSLVLSKAGACIRGGDDDDDDV